MHDIYLQQIQLAQEFLNENHHADVSRLQCLLRKIMPNEYHNIIDKIRLNASTPITINVNERQNIIAPNAISAEQHIHKQQNNDNGGAKHADAEYTAKDIDEIVMKHHNYEWGIKKLQELNIDGKEENKLIDEYLNEILEEKAIISLIKAPKTETQTFTLLEAALTTDHNVLIRKLLNTDFVRNCTNSQYKALVSAAIERCRR